MPPPHNGRRGSDWVFYQPRKRYSIYGILAILLFGMLSFYAFAAVATQLDQIVLPGNELNLKIAGVTPPGIGAPSDKQSAETIDERINILVMGLDRRID